MATEENYPSLYSALYEAMTDPRLIGDLLKHPEFERRAAQLCSEIAGPEGGEELLQTTWQRVLERTSQLNPDSIRSEGAFFEWFTRLARHVHLSNVMSAAAFTICTDATGRWPDSSAAVPRADMARFLAHADACPYHRRILRAEEKAVSAAFSKARGLDSQGRILLGDELHARVVEHERRMENWCQSTARKGEPFGHVALFNGGKEVASCGKFYDFEIHKSVNELDPHAGLQIFGVSSDNSDENVQLGFYRLAGVLHEGVEQTCDLDNGYTVGLRVWHRGETTFELHFRCVETRKLELERDRIEDGSTPTAGWWPLPRTPQASAMYAAVLVVSLLCLQVGKVLGRFEAIRVDPPPMFTANVGAQGERPAPAPDVRQALITQAVATQPKPTPAAQTTGERGEKPRPRAADLRQPQGSKMSASTASQLRDLAAIARNRPDNKARGGIARRKPSDKGMLDSVVAELRGSGYSATQITALNRVADTFRLLSSDGMYPTDGSSALHVARDYRFVMKLGDALKRERLMVMNLTGQNKPNARFNVEWDVSTGSKARAKAREKSFVVTLKAHISEGGEKISPEPPSYEGEGKNLNDAYDNAIAKAVQPIIKQIRGESEAGLSASTAVTGGAGLLVIDRPEEQQIVENKDDGAADPDRPKPNKPGQDTVECHRFTKPSDAAF